VRIILRSSSGPRVAASQSLANAARRYFMKVVLKRVLIAAVLVVICFAILVATKSYGVWVITGIACVLFLLGLLRKDGASGKPDEARADGENRPGTGRNP